MANTAEGLETAPAGEAVNGEAGFAAALKAKGFEPNDAVQDDGAAASDTSIASGLETVEPGGPARGPDGKFVAKSTAAADTPQEGADTSTDGGVTLTSDDPAIAGYLAKYNGNVEEALKAAVAAQSLIGRRDDEREALANRLAQLEGLVEGLKTGVAAQPKAAPLSDEEVEERVSARIATLGFQGSADEAAEWAKQTGDERPLRAIYDQWSIDDPWSANRFIGGYEADLRLAKVQPTETKPDPWVAEQKATGEMTATFKALREQVGADAFAAITTVGEDGEAAITKALASMPDPVIALVTSDDPDTRLAGTRIVADRALLLAGAAPTPAAPAAEAATVEEGMPASVQRKLAGASVATAGLRPAAAAPEGNQGATKEQVLAQFRKDILEAETTSVASGLTYGPQPAR